MSTIVDRFWIFIHRNNCMYVTNKLLSFLIAAGLAVVTASHKKMLQEFTATKYDNAKAYDYIYWLFFIYYSF